MYTPKHFSAPDAQACFDLMLAHPLATLVASNGQTLEACPVPVLLQADTQRLACHVARANPIWQVLQPSPQALVIFNGPQAYLSPNWYPSKPTDHRAVPTWNFLAVHAQVSVRTIDDRLWLREHLSELTRVHEASQALPWSLADAPADFLDKLMEHIVGLEMCITSLQGKWKISQNRSLADQRGVISGLEAQGQPQQLAVAQYMKRRIDAD